MLKVTKYIFLIIPILLAPAVIDCKTADSTKDTPYIYFPRAKEIWETNFMIGVSITKLPTSIVEEEINTAPLLYTKFRLGMPLNFSFNLDLSSNYISNMGKIGLEYHLINGDFVFSFGASLAAWFGHVNFESVKLRSYGFLGTPFVSAGLDVGEVVFTGTLELQWGKMFTYSEKKLLAEFNQPNSAYTVRFIAEQPLWRKNWLLLGVGLHYATFYYESWLTYSAIQEYLFYPEFYLGFVL